MKESIFDKGFDAHIAGKSRDSNPYDKDSQYKKWEEWDTGWELSEEQANLIM